jgi:hypothetical protein
MPMHWRNHLEDKGFAVIKQVASKQDVYIMKQLFGMTWRELTVYPRVSRDDPFTWIDDTSNGSWKPPCLGS